MYYILSFLEGLITFISPCILPLLPIYLVYFLGGEQKSFRLLFYRTLAFVLGFTTIFVSMGVFAGWIGSLFVRYRLAIQLLTGGFVVYAGLYFLGMIPEKWGEIFKGRSTSQTKQQPDTLLSYYLFGIVFSLAWSPCLGVFLGSALSLASHQGTALKGALMLVSYSFGLGLPFMLSAFFMDSLKPLFNKIKANYDIINRVSGIILIILGILMMTGFMTKLQLWLL
ncbi:cytochrome c biogenesis CcdA family protein [Vagococcus lutrae]|uniref:cytochrome c biogenesis CcdA family protein n=1 Tax=Vagococcus lutrae TaxID=81947 RepID=UPI002097CDE9|nr:cytochrome c biogenesis CcdA family protein [Vagococcus lutrae]MCO7150275.1 cytochrome c biogenesis CcdA family protein [Vagococcus lutrae]